jgi:hypothetical protein
MLIFHNFLELYWIFFIFVPKYTVNKKYYQKLFLTLMDDWNKHFTSKRKE